jgi:hypothetical protein
MKDETGKRLVAFGKFAGNAGTYFNQDTKI